MSHHITGITSGIGLSTGYYLGGSSGAVAGIQLGAAAGMELERLATGSTLSSTELVAQKCLLAGGTLVSLYTAANSVSLMGGLFETLLGAATALIGKKFFPYFIHDPQREERQNYAQAKEIAAHTAVKQPSTWERIKSGFSAFTASVGLINTSGVIVKSTAISSATGLAIGTSIGVVTSIVGPETTRKNIDSMTDVSTEYLGDSLKKIGTASIQKFSSIDEIREGLKKQANLQLQKIPLVGNLMKDRANNSLDAINTENAIQNYNKSVDGCINGVNQTIKSGTHYSIEKTDSLRRSVKGQFKSR